MKRLLYIFLIIIFSFTILSAQNTVKNNQEDFIKEYKQTDDMKVRARIVKSLTRLKNEKAFKIFVHDLCFPDIEDRPDGSTKYTTGINNYVRLTIAVYLRYYKKMPKEKLSYAFHVMRKLVDSEKSQAIVRQTMITIASWAKYMGKNYQMLIADTLSKKISLVDKKNKKMVWSIVKSLDLIKYHPEAKRLLLKMRNMGFDAKATGKINKILRSI